MKNIRIPVGISDFEEIRKGGYYYIDKTGLISVLLQERPAKVTLITRPRRFGKTLGMSMLADFFDIGKRSEELFENLEISGNGNLCDYWMNRWPTIFLTFKDVDGLDYKQAYKQLVFQISELYKKHSYLLKSLEIDEDDKKLFAQLKTREADETLVIRSVSLLMRLMETYYGKPVILLMDEYDVPIAKASSNGYYSQMLSVIRGIMSTALKDNTSLKFAVITGCLRVAKESIFTGTNNFVSDTINNSGLDEYFGFTQAEVDKILADADAKEYAECMKNWYDGYHFGEFDIYCPWDVMNYLRDLRTNPQAKPVSYWKNTSGNDIIRSFIDYADSNITEKLEILLAGGYIRERIDENLTYDYLHSSESNFWSVLYMTGYLTQARLPGISDSLDGNEMALIIPNAEIKEIFETTVIRWFADTVKTWNRDAIFQAIWGNDTVTLTKEMRILLWNTISYHDYKEDFYHAFLAGILMGAGNKLESNKEYGLGRPDIVILDRIHNRAAIFEVKISSSKEHLSKDCDRALQQIRDKKYAEAFTGDYEDVFCYGISFYQKDCLVKRQIDDLMIKTRTARKLSFCIFGRKSGNTIKNCFMDKGNIWRDIMTK